MDQFDLQIVKFVEEGFNLYKTDPKLKRLSIDEILDKFSDNNEEYQGSRWGLAAYVFLDKITDFSYDGLIKTLVHGTKKQDILCQCISYILQKKYDISVVHLLIEANKKGLSKQILSYVAYNIAFEKQLIKEEVLEFLEIVYALSDDAIHHMLWSYWMLISNNKMTMVIFQDLKDVNNDIVKRFMPLVCRAAYEEDINLGDNIVIELLSNLKKDNFFITAVCYGLKLSLQHEVKVFENNFSIVNELSNDYVSFKEMIPVLVDYIQCSSQDTLIRDNILLKLKSIKNMSADIRKQFLSSVFFKRNIDSELIQILEELVRLNFNKDKEALKLIDNYYFYRMSDGNISSQEILNILNEIFLANGYKLENFRDFFHIFSNTLCEIGKNQQNLWNKFFDSILQCEDENFAFSLGLYETVINVNISNVIISDKYMNFDSIILIIKLIIYYSVINAKKDCILVFELSKFVKASQEELYVSICTNELFKQYPYTSYEVANEYKHNKYDKSSMLQVKIAESIMNKYEKNRIIYEQTWKDMPDFRIPEKQQLIYQRIQLEQNKKINMEADKKSIFMQILSPNKAILKYGTRIANIHTFSQEEAEKGYNTTDYVKLEIKAELPLFYLTEPVNWFQYRKQLLQQRRDYIETNNKRFSSKT